MDRFIIRVTGISDLCFLSAILEETKSSAIVRGTGIAERSAIFITEKITSGHGIIALTNDNNWAGFAFIQPYKGNKEVSHSGMVVSPVYRNSGIALQLKQKMIELTEDIYPGASMISITTTHAVMKINHQAGFRPVTYNSLTEDQSFWEGCKTCVNHSILVSKDHKYCICTAMKKEVSNG